MGHRIRWLSSPPPRRRRQRPTAGTSEALGGGLSWHRPRLPEILSEGSPSVYVFPRASMRARGVLHRPQGFMAARMRDFLRLWLLPSVVWIVGCSGGGQAPGTTTTTTGTGGGPSGACAVDCSKLKTEK